MKTIVPDEPAIRGWGVDADPENDPAYPMKTRTPATHDGNTWERPSQQSATVEVEHSNERPNLSAVFGTSVPPTGLSGFLRRFAFRYSESSYGHWLPLMFADRLQVIEGIFSDLAHGHFPNFPRELGWGAEWKHNRRGLVLRIIFKVLVVVLIIGAIITAFR
jgi:hypothetical protein